MASGPLVGTIPTSVSAVPNWRYLRGGGSDAGLRVPRVRGVRSRQRNRIRPFRQRRRKLYATGALPDSQGGWDPWLAVASRRDPVPAFMNTIDHRTYPIIDVSYDYGRTFRSNGPCFRSKRATGAMRITSPSVPTGRCMSPGATDRLTARSGRSAVRSGVAGPRTVTSTWSCRVRRTMRSRSRRCRL